MILFDIISASTLLLSTFLGFLRGGSREFFLLSGWGVGIWLSCFSYHLYTPWLSPYFPSLIVQQALLFVGTLIIFFTLGHWSRKLCHRLGLGIFDLYLGIFIGISRGIVLCYALLALLYFTGLSDFLVDSGSQIQKVLLEILSWVLPLIPEPYQDWFIWF